VPGSTRLYQLTASDLVPPAARRRPRVDLSALRTGRLRGPGFHHLSMVAAAYAAHRHRPTDVSSGSRAVKLSMSIYYPSCPRYRTSSGRCRRTGRQRSLALRWGNDRSRLAPCRGRNGAKRLTPLDAPTHQRPTGLHDVPQSWHIRRRFFSTTWPVTSNRTASRPQTRRQIPVHTERGSAPGRRQVLG
jgi:hypothetical protein